MALSPDFVILTAASTGQAGAASQADLAEGLEAAGATVAYFKVTVFDDYLRVLRTLCDITGNEESYQQNGEAVRTAVDSAIATYTPQFEGKKVMVGITYSQGMRVQNASTQTGAMLADMGAVNIADENPSLLKEFSIESLVEINPDYLFVIPMGNTEEAAAAALDALTSNEAWASLTAVQEGRFFPLDKELYTNKPNQRWAEAYENLGKLASAA